MSKNLIYVGIAALLIIAVVLGYKIYQQQTGVTPILPTNLQSQNTSQPTTNQATSAAFVESDNPADRSAVLNFPDSNASEAEKKKWGEKVISIAKQTNLLGINNCETIPT